MKKIQNMFAWADCLGEAVFVINPENGSFLYVNDYAALHLGYTREELMQKNLMNIETKIPDLDIFKAHVAGIKEMGTMAMLDGLHRKKEGMLIPVEVHTTYCNAAGIDYVVAIARDTSRFQKEREEISVSLLQQQILLKEIHHRVKNNLQTISSLLYLGSGDIEDTKALKLLQESQSRIRSIALVHEILYKSDIASRVNVAYYVKSLIDSLVHTYGKRADEVRIVRRIEELMLDMDAAIPCGLIINELIMNALDHAFKESDPEKRIEIELTREGSGAISLNITDNGIGRSMPETLRESAIGLELVNVLVRQLDGTMETRVSDGTGYRIVFGEREEMKPHETDETA